MQNLNARAFYEATVSLSQVRCEVAASADLDAVIDGTTADIIDSLTGQLETELCLLGARAAILSLQRIHARLTRGIYRTTTTRREVVHLIDETQSRLRDELAHRLVFTLDDHKAKYYHARDLFGADVARKFASVAYEIGEAGKCLSLERSTAAVFHSIRCLEAGIKALTRCLQIPDPTKANQRSWAKLLATLKDMVDQKWPASTNRMNGDGEFFDNAYAALAAMQNPWRNSTMHLDQKYTLDEAMHIFEIVRGFMGRLASRMDENGLPLA